MSTTLGDELYDIINDAAADVVSTANRREEDLVDKISDLEETMVEMQERINSLEAES